MLKPKFFACFLALTLGVNVFGKPTVNDYLSLPERMSIGSELKAIFLPTIGFNVACRLVIERTPTELWSLGEISSESLPPYSSSSPADLFSNDSECNIISESMRSIDAKLMTRELSDDVKMGLVEAKFRVVNNFCCVGLLTLQRIVNDVIDTDQSCCCRTLLGLKWGLDEPNFASPAALLGPMSPPVLLLLNIIIQRVL